jgi:hypothetical protein
VRLVALVLDQQEQAVFQRLREWYLDAKPGWLANLMLLKKR